MTVKKKLFVLMLIFLWTSCGENPIQAQVAPTTNQTTTDQAANGVPVVHLARPNGAGVSHNLFTQFNVSPSGLILNNSLNIGLSQLGGIITHNPNYTNQTAGLILNEVIGVNPSLLAGYMEVFGPSAHVILANPNGIICNGAGFINIPRATLTTATPSFDDSGALKALSVERGEIAIEGKGINVSNVDTFDLVTRTAKLNANIYGKEVGVFTGRQTFDYATRTAQAKTENGQPKLEISIDGQAMGAMIANRITLQGTEAGVGVRLDPTMAMNADDIVINSQGQIVLKNDLMANNVHIASQDDMALTGKITAQDTANITSNKQVTLNNNLTAKNANVTSQEDMSLSGEMIVQDKVTLKATNGKMTLNNYLAAKQVDITSQGDMSLEGRMDVQETALLKALDGKIALDNILTANKLDMTSQKDMSLLGRMDVQDTAKLTSNGKLTFNNQLTARQIDAFAQEDMILEGRMEVDDKANLVSNAKIALNNTLTANGADITSQGDMSFLGEMGIKDTVLLKTVNGKMIFNNHLVSNKIYAKSQGDISLLGLMDVKDTAKLTSSGKIGFNNLFKAGKADITSQGVMSLSGPIEVEDTANLTSKDQIALNNTFKAGKVDATSQRDMSLLGRMDVQDAVLKALDGKIIFNNHLVSNQIDAKSQGDISLLGQMDVKDTAKLTSGGKIGFNNLFKAGKADITSQGVMSLSGPVEVQDTANLTSKDQIVFNNTFKAGKVDATSQRDMSLLGRMDAQNVALKTLDGKVILNNAFTANNVDISSQDDISLVGIMKVQDTATLNSVKGKVALHNILNAKKIDITSEEKDLFLGGTIEAEDTTTLKAPNGNIIFEKETRTSGQQQLVAEAKTIQVKEGAGVIAGLDENNDAIPGSDLTMTATQGLYNQKGVIRSGDKITLNTPYLHNDEGAIWSDGNMVLQGLNGQASSQIINDSAFITADQGTLSINTNFLHNRRKNFAPGSKIDEATAKNAPPPGVISSENDIKIQAAAIKNDYSHIKGGKDIALNGTKLEQIAVPICKTETILREHYILEPRNWGGWEHGGVPETVYETVRVSKPETVEQHIGDLKATIEAKGNIDAKFTGPIANKLLIPFSKALEKSPRAPAVPSFISAKIDAVPSFTSAKTDEILPLNIKELAFLPLPKSEQIIRKITGGPALFRPTPPGHNYKIETRPNFVNLASFYGSDYFLSRVRFDPHSLPRRLGDAFFETTLIRQQILEQTGQRWLDSNITSDRLQMQQLLDQGIQASKDFNLSVGIALTTDQAKNLTKNIVWYVNQNIDGETVLVPHLYLAQATKDNIDAGGAIIMAENIDLQSDDSIHNTGTIKAKTNLTLTADKDIKNQSGTLKSDGAMTLVAVNGDIIHETPVRTVYGENGSFSQEIASSKGLIDAEGPLNMTAGQDIAVIGADIKAKGDTTLKAQNVLIEGQKTQQLKQSWGNYENSVNYQASSLSTDGKLDITADKDISVLGSTVAAQGDTTLKAGQDLTIGTTVSQTNIKQTRNNYTSDSSTHTGSTVTSNGNLKMEAGNNLAVVGSQVSAVGDLTAQSDGGLQIADVHDTTYFHQTTQQKKSFGRSRVNSTTQSSAVSKGSLLSAGGKLFLDAEGDIDIIGSWIEAEDNITATTGQNFSMTSGTDNFFSSSYSRKKGIFNSSLRKSVSEGQNQKSAALLSNQDILVKTGKDATIRGSTFVTTGNISIEAGQDVVLDTSENTAYSFNQSKSKRFFIRGVMGLDGFGIGIGISKIQNWAKNLQINQLPSILSAGQNIAITADRDVKTKATQLQAGNSIDIKAGRDVVFEASKNVASYNTYQKTTETGLSLGLNQTVIQSFNQINSAIKNLASGEGTALNEALTAVSSGLLAAKAASKLAAGNIFELGAGLYSKRSKSRLSTTNQMVNPTALDAGHDVTVKAETGSLTAEGTQMNAANNIGLEAEKDLNILAAQNKFNLSAKTQDKYGGFLANIGIGLQGTQAAINVSTQLSQSTTDETQVTHQNAQISAANKVKTVSGGDTKIQGAQLTGNEIEMGVGGNLIVASEQNATERTYRNKSLNLGIGIGSGGELFDFSGTLKNLFTAVKDSSINMGSLGGSYQKDTVDRTFTDVQTKIVGQQDVAINVDKHTDIKGAVIASTQGDVKLETDSFSYENLADIDKSRSMKTSAFVLVNPANFTQQVGVHSIPEIDVQRSKQTTEAISRATVAAPNGVVKLDVNLNPEQGLAGLNQTLAQAQEILNQDSSTLRVVVAVVDPQVFVDAYGSIEQAVTELNRQLTNEAIIERAAEASPETAAMFEEIEEQVVSMVEEQEIVVAYQEPITQNVVTSPEIVSHEDIVKIVSCSEEEIDSSVKKILKNGGDGLAHARDKEIDDLSITLGKVTENVARTPRSLLENKQDSYNENYGPSANSYETDPFTRSQLKDFVETAQLYYLALKSQGRTAAQAKETAINLATSSVQRIAGQPNYLLYHYKVSAHKTKDGKIEIYVDQMVPRYMTRWASNAVGNILAQSKRDYAQAKTAIERAVIAENTATVMKDTLAFIANGMGDPSFQNIVAQLDVSQSSQEKVAAANKIYAGLNQNSKYLSWEKNLFDAFKHGGESNRRGLKILSFIDQQGEIKALKGLSPDAEIGPFEYTTGNVGVLSNTALSFVPVVGLAINIGPMIEAVNEKPAGYDHKGEPYYVNAITGQRFTKLEFYTTMATLGVSQKVGTVAALGKKLIDAPQGDKSVIIQKDNNDGIIKQQAVEGTNIFSPGANITPRTIANQHSRIGKDGTFVTEISSIEKVIGKIPSDAKRVTITPRQARQLELELGLKQHSLESKNILSIVDDIFSRSPRSPLSGNDYFLGGGKGLPGGGREIVIDSIPSAGGNNIRQIIIEIK